MEEDNGGHTSDTDVFAQMAPGVSSFPGTLVSSAMVNVNQVSFPEFWSLDYGGKNDSVDSSSELRNEPIVTSEMPSEPSKDGGVLLADELESYDDVVVDSMDDGDVEKASAVKASDFAETPQENFSSVSGETSKENCVTAKDLGVAVADPLDDDQPLCMVFKKGKLGEYGLASLVGKRPTEDLSFCPPDVWPASLGSPGLDKVKTGQGEGGVVKSGTLKNCLNNCLERSSRKGSMEARRVPRQVKKRR